MAPTTPIDCDALGQARLLASREISAAELRAEYEERLALLNPRLNAVVSELPVAEPGSPEAPFAGVPLLIKDLIATVAGSVQSEGSPTLSGHRAGRDSELVRRYRAAGFALVGKTNTSEFGHKPVTESRLFGAAANPWRLDRNAGGSSGGSAAAVAARLVAVAHGNDAGGSIRIPSSCCGVFGFKPSLGAMPAEVERGPFTRRFVAEHVITRSVRDSAAVFAATARTGVRPSSPGFQEREPKRLRIALSLGAPVDVPVGGAEIAAAEAAGRQCEELGHAVEPVAWPLDGEALARAWFGLWADAIGWQVREASRLAGLPPESDGFDESTWRLYLRSAERTPADSFDDLRALEAASASLDQALARFDVWLSPTLAQPPPPLEPRMDGESRAYLEFSPFTRLANVAGQPSFSAPLHIDPAGLPAGSLFTARRGRDELLFRLAAQLEQTPAWRHEPPPTSHPEGQHEERKSGD